MPSEAIIRDVFGFTDDTVTLNLNALYDLKELHGDEAVEEVLSALCTNIRKVFGMTGANSNN